MKKWGYQYNKNRGNSGSNSFLSYGMTHPMSQRFTPLEHGMPAGFRDNFYLNLDGLMMISSLSAPSTV